MKIYHYLHESATGSATGIVEGWRPSSSPNVVVCPLWVETYYLNVDEQEQGVLVVFDGEILFGGLPKNARVVRSDPFILSCPSKSVRNSPDYVFVAGPIYRSIRETIMKDKTGVLVFRHFVLLPACTAVVRKYRNRSLSPVYVMIQVTKGKNGPVVEWRTTSY